MIIHMYKSFFGGKYISCLKHRVSVCLCVCATRASLENWGHVGNTESQVTKDWWGQQAWMLWALPATKASPAPPEKWDGQGRLAQRVPRGCKGTSVFAANGACLERKAFLVKCRDRSGTR